MRAALTTPLMLAAILLAGCGSDASPPDLLVTGAWARPAPDTGRPTAAYFTIHNDGGTADTLLGALTPVARTVEMHESTADERGVVRMRPVEHVAVPPGDSVAFRPGSLHLMIIGLKRRLSPGDRLPLTLMFARRDILQVEVVVKER